MNKKITLREKTLIVTGAAKGLGRLLTLKLINDEGARIAAVDIDDKALQELKEELSAEGQDRLFLYRADLTKETDIRSLTERIFSEHSVDGLINNAGMTDFGRCDLEKLEKYRLIYKLNIMGTVTMSLMLLEYFKKRKARGFIYNISSLTAMVPVAYQTVYSSSKHALQSFTFGLMEEQRERKEIFIGLFAPGGMKTPMYEESGLSRHFGTKTMGIVEPDIVAGKVLKALKKGRPFTTATLFDKLCILMIKLSPSQLSRSIMRRVYQ